MVQLSDLTEGLMDYQRQAQGKAPEERLPLWEAIYAARHREFFRWYLAERCSREKLAQRLPGYDARHGILERPSRVLPAMLNEIWPQVLTLFGEDSRPLRAVLFAGGFDADGFCEYYNGQLAAFFQAEVLCAYPDGLLRVHAVHEMAHFLHAHYVLMQEPSFSYKDRYFEIPVALFCEGLAVAASCRVCPGEGTGRYLLSELSDPAAADWCQTHERQLFRRVREVLGCSDAATFRSFFSGARPEGVPHTRTGYYVGWQVMERILRDRGLPEALRLRPSEWPELVTGALGTMCAG
jgi:hypothetical protein